MFTLQNSVMSRALLVATGVILRSLARRRSRSPPTGVSCPSAHRNSKVCRRVFTRFNSFNLISSFTVFESIQSPTDLVFPTPDESAKLRPLLPRPIIMQNFYTISLQHKTRWPRHAHRVSYVMQFARGRCLNRPKHGSLHCGATRLTYAQRA